MSCLFYRCVRCPSSVVCGLFNGPYELVNGIFVFLRVTEEGRDFDCVLRYVINGAGNYLDGDGVVE